MLYLKSVICAKAGWPFFPLTDFFHPDLVSDLASDLGSDLPGHKTIGQIALKQP